jgi:flagellar protein FliS
MNGREIEREGWRIAAQNTSPVGLTIILYDLLASDLRRGVSALHAGDIELRCRELNHAFAVLAQLEAALDFDNAGPISRQLAQFYSHLRAKILEAQIKQSAPLFERLIEQLLDVRRAWQQVELQEAVPAAAPLAPSAFAAATPPAVSAAASSWSA